MLRHVLLIALMAVAAASGTKSAYLGYNLRPVLSGIGLPSLYKPRDSLSGLMGYLQQTGVSEAKFIARVQKYGPVISRNVHLLRKQYKGVSGDLLQLAVLRYYGSEPNINHKLPLAKYFGRYIRRTKIPSSVHYNPKYVKIFLGGYRGYLHKHVKPQKIVNPVPLPTPTYHGYELLATLKSIGLPELSSPKSSLGGIVAYLKVAKISKATFISRILIHGSAIRKVVVKYQKHYKGLQLDLLQVAALRYFGIAHPSGYKARFGYALKQALKARIYTKYSVTYVSTFLIRFSKILVTLPCPGYDLIPVLKRIGLPKLYSAKYPLGGLYFISAYKKYSVSFVSSFLIRFSKYLVRPVYPGYQLKPLLVRVGLPRLTRPKLSLAGLVAYLQSSKFSQAALISRIQKYGPNIKATVHRYQKKYSGIRADLLQLCAIRYYAFPLVIRHNVRFGHAFHKYLSSQSLKLYNASVVNKFLSGFIKYIRKYQLKKYTGAFW